MKWSILWSSHNICIQWRFHYPDKIIRIIKSRIIEAAYEGIYIINFRMITLYRIAIFKVHFHIKFMWLIHHIMRLCKSSNPNWTLKSTKINTYYSKIRDTFLYTPWHFWAQRRCRCDTAQNLATFWIRLQRCLWLTVQIITNPITENQIIWFLL